MEGGVGIDKLECFLVFLDRSPEMTRVIEQSPEVVVRLRVVFVQLDRLVVFLFGFAVTMHLEKTDAGLVMQHGAVLFLPGSTVVVDRIQVKLLATQSVALRLQVLRCGVLRRRRNPLRKLYVST